MKKWMFVLVMMTLVLATSPVLAMESEDCTIQVHVQNPNHDLIVGYTDMVGERPAGKQVGSTRGESWMISLKVGEIVHLFDGQSLTHRISVAAINCPGPESPGVEVYWPNPRRAYPREVSVYIPTQNSCDESAATCADPTANSPAGIDEAKTVADTESADCETCSATLNQLIELAIESVNVANANAQADLDAREEKLSLWEQYLSLWEENLTGWELNLTFREGELTGRGKRSDCGNQQAIINGDNQGNNFVGDGNIVVNENDNDEVVTQLIGVIESQQSQIIAMQNDPSPSDEWARFLHALPWLIPLCLVILGFMILMGIIAWRDISTTTDDADDSNTPAEPRIQITVSPIIRVDPTVVSYSNLEALSEESTSWTWHPPSETETST